MARVLIVGCGCRGQALARDLVAAGHAVRGTTRDEARTARDRRGRRRALSATPTGSATLMDALAGVDVVCWLLGRVPDPDLHGGRLRMLFEKLVDTPGARRGLRGARLPRGRGESSRDAARALAASRVEIVEPSRRPRARRCDRLLGG